MAPPMGGRSRAYLSTAAAAVVIALVPSSVALVTRPQSHGIARRSAPVRATTAENARPEASSPAVLSMSSFSSFRDAEEKRWKPGSLSDEFGTSALNQVRNLATAVTTASGKGNLKRKARTTWTGGTGSLTKTLQPSGEAQVAEGQEGEEQKEGIGGQSVISALARLERDMQMLDNLAGARPQLSKLELVLLSASVLAAASGPVFSLELTDVLAPAAAAFSASIGIGAEYIGKVAVADGKEVAAATIQCAAEAEGLLANAERVKAITPLCVGVGATGATFALLAPVLIEALKIGGNTQLITELYLFCPLVSILSAAVAGLALQEVRSFSSRAISVGNRRFAKSGIVGRTWLSSTELIEKKSMSTSDRWTSFGLSVLPAPVLGALVPGVLSTKAIVVASLAAAQSAFSLAQAEYTLARATDAVALKTRSAAVSDTYANQGARSAAILPFTSALSALCAATTAAIVELPWLGSLEAIGGPVGTASQVALISFFPTLGALFAGAASVSKARCEVDAEAASQAASTLALEFEDKGDPDDDPVLRPARGVLELIMCTASSFWKISRKNGVFRRLLAPIAIIAKGLKNLRRRKEEDDSAAVTKSA